MDIDVVLVPASAPALHAPGHVLKASSGRQLVAAIRAALGSGGRLDRLRIVDAFGGTGSAHPLQSFADLGALRALFAPGGSVEIVAGPAPVAGSVRVSPSTAGLGGFNFGGGFQGATKMGTRTQTALNIGQLSAVLGVPVSKR